MSTTPDVTTADMPGRSQAEPRHLIYAVGDPDPTSDQADGLGCEEEDGGFWCTWDMQDHTGQHVAGDGDTVVRVWLDATAPVPVGADQEALRRELAEALSKVSWPDGAPMVQLASRHRLTVADALLPIVERAIAAGQAQALTEAAGWLADALPDQPPAPEIASNGSEIGRTPLTWAVRSLRDRAEAMTPHLSNPDQLMARALGVCWHSPTSDRWPCSAARLTETERNDQ